MYRTMLILNVGLLLTVFTNCSRDEKPKPVFDPRLQTPADNTFTLEVAPENANPADAIGGDALAGFLGKTVKESFESIDVPTKSDNGGKFDNSPYQKREVTRDSYQAEELRFFGTCLQEYKSSGKDPAELKEKVSKFVTDVLRKDVLYARQYSWEELFQQGELLVGSDVTKCDPVLLSHAGLCAVRSFHFGRAEQLLFAAVRQYANSNYTSRHAVRAHRWLAECVLPFTEDGDLRNKIRQNYISAVEHWLTRDLRATADEQRLVVGEVSSMFRLIREHSYITVTLGQRTPEFAAIPMVVAKIEAANGFPPWLLNMINGWYRYHLGLAWRGSGYTETISEEMGLMMEQNFVQAKTYFLKAYEINPAFPEPCVGVMEIARNFGDQPLMEEWFQKAVAAQFDYEFAYNSKLNSLEPKWGGSIPDMIKFGEECVATERYDTMVPYMIVRIEDRIRRNGTYSESSNRLMLTAMEKLAEKTNDEQGIPKRSVCLTLLACNALTQGDVKRSYDAFRKLGGKIDPIGYWNFNDKVGDQEVFRGLAAAMGSERREAAQTLIPLFSQMARFDVDELGRFKDALSQVQVDKVSSTEQVYWKSAAKILDLHRGIISGEWMDLPFTDPQEHVWTYQIADRWQPSEGAVEVGTKETIGAFLPFTPDRPFVFQCDVEVVDYYGDDFTAGFSIGPYDDPTSAGFTINPKVNQAMISNVSSAEPFRLKWQMMPGKNRITVVAYPGYYQMQVNGELIREESNDRFHIDAGHIYLLAVPMATRGGGVVRFSNARIRGWNHGLPPAERNVATRLKYYQRITDHDPSHVYAWYEQGIIHIRKEEYEEAEKCFQSALENGANPARVTLYLGEVYEARGEWAKAVEAFETAIVTKEEYDKHYEKLQQAMFTLSPAGDKIEKEYQHDYRWRYRMKLAWILFFAPDDNVRNPERAAKSMNYCSIFERHEYPWLGGRMEAARHLESNRAFALQKLAEVITNAPESEKAEAHAQADAYISGKPYLMKPGMQILKYPPVDDQE